jgi:hypothetical protein
VKAFGLLYGYKPITATVVSVGTKDTTSGAITMLTSCFAWLLRLGRWPLRPEAKSRCGLPGLRSV